MTGVKKTLTKYGEVTIVKSNPYIDNTINGFGISPLVMELMTYTGHMDCYGRSNEIIKRFLSIDVSPSQVYRVTDAVSEALEDSIDNEERILPQLPKDDMLFMLRNCFG